MTFLDAIDLIFTHTTFGWICAALFALMGAWRVKVVSNSTVMAVSYYPWLWLGGLIGDAAFLRFGLFWTADAEFNAVIAVVTGAAITVIVLLMGTHLLYKARMLFVTLPLDPAKRLLIRPTGPTGS